MYCHTIFKCLLLEYSVAQECNEIIKLFSDIIEIMLHVNLYESLCDILISNFFAHT